MIVTAAIFLQYASCVGLFHANRRRTNSLLMSNSVNARHVLKLASVAALTVSLFLCASLQGWERGIPLFLALIGLTGFASLFVVAYLPSQHIHSAKFALIVCLALMLAKKIQ